MLSSNIKEQIEILNKEDIIRLEKCGWIKNRYYNSFEKLSDRLKEAKWWYSKFCEYLPTPYLVKMQRECNNISMFFQLSKFEKILKQTRIEIIYIYSCKDIDFSKKEDEKEKLPMPREWVALQPSKPKNDYYQASFEQYRNSKKIVNPNCNEDQEIPTIGTLEAWGTVIEVVEYYGMKIVKYDIFKKNYCIIIYLYGTKPVLLYDKDASIVEKKADEHLNDYINKQMEYNKNKNPYGNKSKNNNKTNKIDISNIQQAMGMDSNIELVDDSEIDDIF